MQKTLVLMLSAVLCASMVAAEYAVQIANNNGSKSLKLTAPDGTRPCICLASTQTATIKGINGGNIKVFSSVDCTGNYQTIGSNSAISNAQWVNSISFGASGSSSGPGSCPNWYNN
ncbi:hypothetical protein EMPS_08409 [Entomortierella parvispora]|uniref:Uncharacterized protein n=1 Tax=Entomortierella parvispora TaxID=205924 RepID=A0A9P3HFY6_9FUNG|nr:hypothetical protein EMPS_08409 [Entomortierella parvispora]